ncbi:hypothetical protein M9458_054950, partial [Cirrhinus mrigala]
MNTTQCHMNPINTHSFSQGRELHVPFRGNEYPEEMCWCGVKRDPSRDLYPRWRCDRFLLYFCPRRSHRTPLTDVNTAPGSCVRIEPPPAFSTRLY